MRIIVTSLFITICYLTANCQKLQKTLANNKYCLNVSLDKIKEGDTLVFTLNEKKGSLYFRRNGKLKEHTFYGYCGNKYFLDYFIPKPPEFTTVGFWTILENNKIPLLTFNIEEKKFVFIYLHSDKDTIRFIVQ